MHLTYQSRKATATRNRSSRRRRQRKRLLLKVPVIILPHWDIKTKASHA